MHDVNKSSIIKEGKKKKPKIHPAHSQEDVHQHHHSDEHNNHDSHPHDHDLDHDHDHTRIHDHPISHGHDHDHDDSAYEGHDRDIHVHHHEHEPIEDRAFAHIHEHGHNFYHLHHHSHHPEHTSLMHRIFSDPVRDWFGAVLMGLLVVIGYFKWLPGNLSEGILVCAAVIGIFPILKKALFDSITRRTFRFELFIGALLLGGLCLGEFLEVALITLFLLVGSFMRLNFSWKD